MSPDGAKKSGAGQKGRTGASEPEAEAGFLPELLRRGLTLGFTGLFMTEEALRRALGDSVPRDLLEFFVQQSDRTRAEFLDRLSSELGRALSSLDPAEVLARLVEGRTLEVSAKIRFADDAADPADPGAARSTASVRFADPVAGPAESPDDATGEEA
jgi:hypothetical protein